MLKKITVLFTFFCLLFSFTVSANEEFMVYGEDNGKMKVILGMSDKELEEYIAKNKITYFAINGNNTKQIKRTEFTDSFSKKAVDLSVLGDAEIFELSEDISGFSNAKGEIINYADFKFLKFSLGTKDSGGEYTLTQYITVKNAQNIVLSFYTASGENEDYIEKMFREQFKSEVDYKPFIVVVGVILFSLIAVVIVVLIIKDLKKKEVVEADSSQESEN